MLNFQPPSFVKPINYDFGSSLDNIYEQYMKQKLLQSQLEGQSLQQRQLRGQIGMQQGQIGMQNLEQTARFGRPVS